MPFRPFIALFVCLIPTTIGGLLSAIGIAGMDRALRANVITKSGKAVETAGDIDVLLLDKTGTITIGNRKATHFWPAPGVEAGRFVELVTLSSLTDETPEGKSIVELGREQHVSPEQLHPRLAGAELIKFTAETRSSGVTLADGTSASARALPTPFGSLSETAGQAYPGEETERVSHGQQRRHPAGAQRERRGAGRGGTAGYHQARHSGAV